MRRSGVVLLTVCNTPAAGGQRSRPRFDMHLRRFTQCLLLALPLAMLACIAFASLNELQWQIWKQSHRIDQHGTRDAQDLDLYVIERVWALQDSFIMHAGTDVAAIDRDSWRPAQHVCVPAHYATVAGLLKIMTLAASTALLSLVGAHVGAWLGARRIVSTIGRPALRELSLSASPETHPSRLVPSVLCLLPPLMMLAWYIGYDRAQQQAFVAHTFVPQWTEMGAVVLALAALSAAWSYRRSPLRLRMALNRDLVGERLYCLACGYDIGQASAARCPECGALSTHEHVRLNLLNRRAVAISAILTCALITCLVVSSRSGLVLRHVRNGPDVLARAFSWLTMRHDTYDSRPRGTFRNGEVLSIEWDDRDMAGNRTTTGVEPGQRPPYGGCRCLSRERPPRRVSRAIAHSC